MSEAGANERLLKRLKPAAVRAVDEEFLGDRASIDVSEFEQPFVREVDLTECDAMLKEVRERYDRPTRQASDGWLGPRLHATLRLTPREAADPTLWNHLSLVRHPDYVHWRWMPAGEGKRTAVARFTGGPTKHALARLWWWTELTRNGPSYETCETAWIAQDIPNTWFRLDLMHNRPAALGALRVMKDLHGGKAPAWGGEGDKKVKATKKVNMLATATNVAAATISLDALVPASTVDAAVWAAWCEGSIEAEDYFDRLPNGPDEPPVDDELLDRAESFVRKVAEDAGLFRDQSGDPLGHE